MNFREHEERVKEFFKECSHEDPKNYEKVCEKYPTLTLSKFRKIKVMESPVGLIGLQPCNLGVTQAFQAGVESEHYNEEE